MGSIDPPPDYPGEPVLPSPRPTAPPDIDHPPGDGARREYPDWTPETTRIALAPRAHHEDWESARAYFEHRYGRVFEDCSTAKWWAARVPRAKEKP